MDKDVHWLITFLAIRNQDISIICAVAMACYEAVLNDEKVVGYAKRSLCENLSGQNETLY